MFDPLDPYDQVADEIEQRRVTGYDVAAVATRLAAAARTDKTALEALYRDVLELPRPSSWDFDEPSDLRQILQHLPADRNVRDVDPASIPDRVLAGWLGRIAGCNVGKPVEGGTGVDLADRPAP